MIVLTPTRRVAVRTLPALLACCAILAPGALATRSAAGPAKGATYVGELSATQFRVSKRVVMKVSQTRRTATAQLYCNGTRFGSLPRFKIDHGRFSGTRKVGTITVWRLRGRFVSRKKARAKLSLPTTCDAKGGRITLLRKP